MNISATVGRAHLIGNWKLETYCNVATIRNVKLSPKIFCTEKLRACGFFCTFARINLP